MIKVHVKVWIVSGMNRISLHTVYPHDTGFEPFSVILLSKHGLSVEPTPSLVRAPSRWSTDVNLSVTVGQGRASSSAPGCVCSVQADLLSPWVVPDGRGASCPWLSSLEMARRREIPQIRRQPGKPDHKLLTSAAPQQPPLSWTDRLWDCAQGSDWHAQSTSVRAHRLDCSDILW